MISTCHAAGVKVIAGVSASLIFTYRPILIII